MSASSTRAQSLAVLIAALIVSLPAAGCSKVGGPIREENLVAVLVDLHLVESRREIVGDMPPEMRDSVLSVHGISPERYADAIRYYSRHPDEYLELYNTVIDSLSAELGTLEESGRVEIPDP